MLAIQMLHLGVLALLGYPNAAVGSGWATAVAGVLESLAVMMLAGLSIAANNRAVAWIYLDRPATVRGATASVMPRLRSYLWLMTITAFRAWAPLSALYVVMFATLFSIMPKGFFSDPALAQNDLIGSRGQQAINAFDAERMLEGNGFVPRARGHALPLFAKSPGPALLMCIVAPCAYSAGLANAFSPPRRHYRK